MTTLRNDTSIHTNVKHGVFELIDNTDETYGKTILLHSHLNIKVKRTYFMSHS